MFIINKIDDNGLVLWEDDMYAHKNTPYSIWRTDSGYIIKRLDRCIGTYDTLTDAANELMRLEEERVNIWKQYFEGKFKNKE